MDLQLLLLMGLVQGILEWLPISSEGFLFVIATGWGQKPSFAFLISVMFHLPTGLASIIYFRDKYFQALKSVFKGEEKWVFNLLFYSTVGTVLTGLPLYVVYKLFLEQFETAITLFSIVAIVLVGVVMILLGLFSHRAFIVEGEKSLSLGSVRDFLIVGLLQGLAIIPGVSRSGVTIACFLFLKYDKEEAVKGSFLMLPVVSFSAFLVEFLFNDIPLGSVSSTSLLLSMILAFIVSLFVMKFLLDVARRLSFWKFMIFFGVLIVVLGISYLVITG